MILGEAGFPEDQEYNQNLNTNGRKCGKTSKIKESIVMKDRTNFGGGTPLKVALS
jgi:hypothetical protein